MDELVKQPRILLMDADPGRCAHRASQLGRHGWGVIRATDALEALSLAHLEPVDLALLHMPPHEAAGMDLPRVLRGVADERYMLVVVLADKLAEADCCRFLDSGADDILPETTRPNELVARLRALLRIKELQDALRDSQAALQQSLLRERELLRKLQADNAELAEMALTDPLTHLHNVRYFQRFLADEFKIARRYNQPISLLTLDLDHFKRINDRYGHPAGDFVLKEVSVIMRQNVRESDVVARTGGEEFAIVQPRADRVQAGHLAHRIRQAMAGHAMAYGSQRIRVTCSIGVATYPQDADVLSAQHLLYFADQALLVAKQSGRNCVVHWFEMDGHLKARLRGRLAAPDAEIEGGSADGEQQPAPSGQEAPARQG